MTGSMRPAALLAILALTTAIGLAAGTAPRPLLAATVGTETGLPIPRYVTLRAREVNVRAGPGVRYPIDWVYQRPNLPVEVIAEFDTWRKIRDPDGTEGWVHQSMLSGRRTVVVIGGEHLLRRTPDPAAAPVARLEAGVIGWLDGCRRDWCEIDVGGLDGWIQRAHIWGVRADEVARK
ncbi:SH3 domain-containing protein [Thalassobaculum sp.]|uniref:SH3 domain-containing protein n=1 Tax=Thalassobaculum sp. TaxID=2022740 RepID=UPI0032EF526A